MSDVDETPKDETTPETASEPAPTEEATDAAPSTGQLSNSSKLAIIGVLSVGIIVAVLSFAIIGGDDENGGGSDATVSSNLDEKPTPQAPGGEPPTELVIEDIVQGDGETAEAGDQISVQYVGVLYEDGTEFDSSWSRDQTFDFELGAGNVIEGWDEGLVGMKVGGRRQLTIPAEQAYGPSGSPPVIGPDAALVFVVDLVEIN